MKHFTELLPRNTYYLQLQTVGWEKAFLSDRNYFLKRYCDLFLPVSETLAYCLLPDQIHFIVRIEDHKTLRNFFQLKSSEPVHPHLISNQFGLVLSSYTQAFNKDIQRKGKLFDSPAKRECVSSDHCLNDLIKFIHRLPVDLGCCDRLDNWEYSSYFCAINHSGTFALTEEVIKYFHSMDEMIEFHNSPCVIKFKQRKIYPENFSLAA